MTLLDEDGYTVLREYETFQDRDSADYLAYCSDGWIREYTTSEYGRIRPFSVRVPLSKEESRIMKELLS